MYISRSWLIKSYFIAVLCLLPGAFAAGADQWRNRSIYQVLVDRFSPDDGSTTQKCNVTERVYCGGTWDGIKNKLSYIQGMGFDAIWISPISAGIDENTEDGWDYTGYWVQDLTKLNPHFGTSASLKSLSDELHSRGMFLMLDIVVNNMAIHGDPLKPNYGPLNPFNKASYFHPYCPINYADRTSTLNCWMGDTFVPLPDLDTENPAVQEKIADWIKDTVDTYGIDGLRIDAAKSIPYDFARLVNNVTDSYAMGEVFDGDAGYACAYQKNGLDGFLNFPSYYQLLGAFYSTTSTQMAALTNMISSITTNCKDPTLLGNFAETHDVPRIGYYTQDLALYKNIATWEIMHDGIPVVYQGQEHQFTGGNDPYNREAVWLSGWSMETPLYLLFAHLNAFRKLLIAADDTYAKTLSKYPYVDVETFTFYKKNVLTVLTNSGVQAENYTVTIPLSGGDISAGTQLTDIISCATIMVGSTGSAVVTLNQGMPMVFYPSDLLKNQTDFQCGLKAGSDTPTNAAADAESGTGTHDPYAGTTYTPGPSPNAAGLGIAGMKRQRSRPRQGGGGVVEKLSLFVEWRAILWTVMGIIGVLVFL